MHKEAPGANMTYRGHMKNGVAVLDEPASLPDGTRVRVEIDPPQDDFWATKTVQDLAHEQGVPPLQSLEDLAGEWPAEDSIDEFLALVHKARR